MQVHIFSSSCSTKSHLFQYLFIPKENTLCLLMLESPSILGTYYLFNCVMLTSTHHISRPGGGDQDGMASTIGIMQALISVFLDDNDKLRSINAGRTRITFLLRQPLYYVCVSSWGEPESVVRASSTIIGS